MWQDKPFFGFGPGTYQFEYGPYQRSYEKTRISTDFGTLRSMPFYMLLGGGLLGAIYVLVNLILAPKIGVAALMSLAIAGQLAAALFLDRFGLFDLVQRELSLGRVSGVILVLVGALMVRML